MPHHQDSSLHFQVLQYLDKEMKKMNSVVSSEIDEEKNDTRSEKR